MSDTKTYFYIFDTTSFPNIENVNFQNTRWQFSMNIRPYLHPTLFHIPCSSVHIHIYRLRFTPVPHPIPPSSTTLGSPSTYLFHNPCTIHVHNVSYTYCQHAQFRHTDRLMYRHTPHNWACLWCYWPASMSFRLVNMHRHNSSVYLWQSVLRLIEPSVKTPIHYM